MYRSSCFIGRQMISSAQGWGMIFIIFQDWVIQRAVRPYQGYTFMNFCYMRCFPDILSISTRVLRIYPSLALDLAVCILQKVLMGARIGCCAGSRQNCWPVVERILYVLLDALSSTLELFLEFKRIRSAEGTRLSARLLFSFSSESSSLTVGISIFSCLIFETSMVLVFLKTVDCYLVILLLD